MNRRRDESITPRAPHGLLLLVLAIALIVAVQPLVVGAISTASPGDLLESTRSWWIVLVPALALGLVILFSILAFRRSGQDSSEQERSSNVSPPGRVIGSTHFRTITADRPTTRFTDVAGVEEAKEELAEVVEFLRCPEKFLAVGARVPRGVLLVGPPGTGKTLLARAVAGEAGVPFISASGSEFVELYVGVGASRVRSLFQEARRQAPCIVFIDEIDAVGRRRGGNVGISHEEREQTLNQILVEMDGFDQRQNVMVIAATNRADVLDPALLRPGRFDRQVMLDLPDARGRLAILQVHARGKPLAPEVDFQTIARQTAGLSGADLENLINEAAIIAARHDRRTISPAELEEALDRVVAGPRRKSRILSEREKRITAYHEIGHALVAFLLPHADRVLKVSIVSRGQAGGYTRIVPDEDRNMWSKSQFEAAITAALGGHAAEQLIFGEVTTGPSNDLQRATEIARRMVAEFGMSAEIGPMSFAVPAYYGDGTEFRGFGEEVARQLDAEVRRVISRAHLHARQLLQANRHVLDASARALIERETIEWPELAALFEPARSRSVPAPPVPAHDERPVETRGPRAVLSFLRQRRRGLRGSAAPRPALASRTLPGEYVGRGRARS